MAASGRKATQSRRGGRRRRDVASRESLGRQTMIRFVVDPEGQIVPDLGERLPGRGIWLTASRSAIEASIDGRAFARAARRAVRVSPSLLGEIEAAMRRRCIDGLGLARRAGALVAGFDKVVETLRQGRVGLLIAASDASDGQRRRLYPLADGVPVATCLSRDEVGGAVGREEVTYAAISAGPLALRLERDLRRLAGILGLEPFDGPTDPVGEDDGSVALDPNAQPVAEVGKGDLAAGERRTGSGVAAAMEGERSAGSADESVEPTRSAGMLTESVGPGRDNEDDDAA